jgi:hypothetical protein
MPTNRFTDATLRALKPQARPFKVADGGGLYLLVQPGGAKLWRLDYRFAGKRRTLALGGYPAVGLAQARVGRDEAKRLLLEGRDPGHARREAKAAAERAADRRFATVADRWFRSRRAGWVPGYADR